MRTKAAQPQRIDTRAGPAEALGNPALLCGNLLALLCSQKCPGEVILQTYDFARLVRVSGRLIVSGFHSSIERDSLPILLRGSGPIVICQGHRLSTSRLPVEWQKAIDAGRLLLVSPFPEKEKRVTTKLAVERNRFVAAIADELLVPYAAPGSKTESLVLELLVAGKRVYTFESPSNAVMVARGAVAVAPEFFSRAPGATAAAQ